MLTKSEFLFCGTVASALLAYSVSHHVDPAIATRELTNAVLDATVYGIKTGAQFLYQAGRAGIIVFGTYTALKTVIRVGKAIKRNIEIELEDDNEEESQEEMSFEVGPEEELVAEEVIEVEQEEFEEDIRLQTWDPSLYNDEEDDDFNPKDLDKSEGNLLDDEAEADFALTQEELNLLLADQAVVSFCHGKVKLEPLIPIENTSIKGPYRLRPRSLN